MFQTHWPTHSLLALTHGIIHLEMTPTQLYQLASYLSELACRLPYYSTCISYSLLVPLSTVHLALCSICS